jgi:hypothetical protein
VPVFPLGNRPDWPYREIHSTHTHTHTAHRRMHRSIETYCIRLRLYRPHNRPSCHSDGAGGYSRSCSTCTGRMKVVPVRSRVALEQKFHRLIQHKVQAALRRNCLCSYCSKFTTLHAERASCLLIAVILTATLPGLSLSLRPN